MQKLEDIWNEVIRRAETTDALFCIFKKRGGKTQFIASNSSQLNSYNPNSDGFILSSFEDGDLKMIPNDHTFDLNSANDVDRFNSYLQNRIPVGANPCGCQNSEVSSTSAESYEKSFCSVKKTLDSKDASKIVLSARHSIPTEKSSFEIFTNIASKDSYEFAYLLHLPNGETWIGNTPEILLQKNGESYSTISLAGTIANDGKQQWHEKEIREQKVVTDYITERLKSVDANITVGTTHSKPAGMIQHLCTDISFTSTESLSSLIGLLHPTPAVLGFPTSTALSAIKEAETQRRELYSGVVGFQSKSNNEANIFVNLRCGKLKNNILTLFAGGGIMPDSTKDNEWKEVQMKFESIRRAFFE